MAVVDGALVDVTRELGVKIKGGWESGGDRNGEGLGGDVSGVLMKEMENVVRRGCGEMWKGDSGSGQGAGCGGGGREQW